MWSHCVVSSHCKISDYLLLQNFKLYLRKQFFGNKAKKHFKAKQELAMQLIDEFTPATEIILSTDVSLTASKILLYHQNRCYIEVSYQYHKNSLGLMSTKWNL